MTLGQNAPKSSVPAYQPGPTESGEQTPTHLHRKSNALSNLTQSPWKVSRQNKEQCTLLRATRLIVILKFADPGDCLG
jgi:hypothetical protein